MSSYMTQAPLELTVGDKSLILYPLRDRDCGVFERWCQDRYIETTKRNISDLPKEDQRVYMMQAFDRAALITFSSQEARILMGTVEGAARLLYLSINQGDAAFTLDDARALTVEPSFVEAALEKIASLMAPPDTSEKSKPKKNQAKKQHVKKSTKS